MNERIKSARRVRSGLAPVLVLALGLVGFQASANYGSGSSGNNSRNYQRNYQHRNTQSSYYQVNQTKNLNGQSSTSKNKHHSKNPSQHKKSKTNAGQTSGQHK